MGNGRSESTASAAALTTLSSLDGAEVSFSTIATMAIFVAPLPKSKAARIPRTRQVP